MIARSAANVILIWGFAGLYFFSSYYSQFLSADVKNVLFNLAIGLTIISAVEAYVLSKGKRLNFGLKVWVSLKQFSIATLDFFREPTSRFQLGFSAKKNLLFTLVKFFFLPIMVKFAVANFNTIRSKIEFVTTQDLNWLTIDFFNSHFYGFALASTFLIDTGFFAFGYLFEAGWLRNKVRSVDMTLTGWAVTIACYPPFAPLLGNWIPWGANDYAYFSSSEITFGIRIILVILLAGYVTATISLGTKCSNLTNRGIVTTGAYRYVRHPAYTCKNLFWWIVLIPAIQHNPVVLAGMAFWTVLYFLRAITEEQHLIKDPDYGAYFQQVKWRFIPGLI